LKILKFCFNLPPSRLIFPYSGIKANLKFLQACRLATSFSYTPAVLGE